MSISNINSNNLLSIRGLKTYFYTDNGVGKAVDGLNLDLRSQEILGIVGESGCGKSVTALSILRLVPSPQGRIVGGQIFFKETDLLKLSEEKMRKVRGSEISMIFQEPMTSLNPVFTIGTQIIETLQFHRKIAKKEALERAIELLKLVGIPEPVMRLKNYPFELSGGMRQRVMIAIALSCEPELMIADEPTTALDVTVQAQILDLMKSLTEEVKTAIIIITHDLGVVAEYAQRVAVMYTGRIVEFADTKSLFKNPLHPYTRGLMASIPRIRAKRKRLEVIPGVVPNLQMLPEGCKFSNRCSHFRDKCLQEPELVDYENGHLVRCFNVKN
jgi:oligopeptide/dipeptide ABC transporter ATP-binding protein